MLPRGVQDDARAIDIGAVDFVWRIQRQGRRAMHADIDALHCLVDMLAIADIAADILNLLAFGIVEVGQI